MSGINKILKNKFGIDRKSKPVQQDKWLKSQRSIEEDLLLQQQLVEAKQKSIEEEELQDIEEQPKPVEKKSLSEDDTKKIAAFSELIKSFGVEIEPEIIEEDLQLQVEDITPVPVVVSHTPVDIREAVKLVTDKTLPTKEETIESTQELITNVVNNLEDMKDRTEVKEEINEIDLLRREFNALQVQVKQSSTFIGSGAGSGEVRLEFLDDVQRSTAKVNGKFLKFDSSSGKFVGDDPTVSTLALTALDIDGATDIGAAIVDADLFIIDDGAGGTNRKVTASRIKTYIGDHTDSLAADNLTIGDAAILLTTSSGNITIDAAANDSDIILKGTDGNADTTFLTIDGSAAGEATFNAGIVIADSGTIGSASDKDAIAIASNGVVTMNQIPVFSAGINVSGGTIAGTLATAAQTNITTVGTLTTLTVDSIIINGTNIGHTSDTDAIAIASNGVVTFSQVPVLPDDTIETADIQDNAVTPAKIAGAVNAQTGTAYTSVIGDAFKTVTMSNGSANKLTIPPNSSVAYAVGDRIDVVMLGSGTTSIQGGSGVTVNAVSTGTVAIAAQFAAVSCLKIATDTWVAMGNHGGVS